MLQGIAFYLMAATAVVSGLLVVTARNPVHSVLWLILAFFSSAGLFVLLGAEFLAMLLVVVYVGAVAVLFLFVVMMLDVDVDSLRRGFWKHFPLAAIIGVVIALEMSYVLMGGFRDAPQAVVAAGVPVPNELSNTKLLGKLLYTEYLFPLEVAAVILLVAMIAAIALTLRQRKDTKFVDPADQVRVKARDRLQVVKVAVTKPPVPQPAPETTASAEKKA